MYIDTPPYRTMIISFGKHKGRDIKDVIETDPSYCGWLKNQPWAQKNKDLMRYIKDIQIPDLNFGKHKNKSLDWIKENDPNYIDWLKKSDYVSENCPTLESKLKNY